MDKLARMRMSGGGEGKKEEKERMRDDVDNDDG